MKIIIETIPHKKQRYETCGDWQIEKDGTIRILVSETGDDDYNFLVGLHEAVEVKLCQKRGISQTAVDDFDIEFEKQRAKSITLSNQEPGDNHFAPYQNEHCIATGIERVVAAALQVKWNDYETKLNSL
jgi:hypothetical protein